MWRTAVRRRPPVAAARARPRPGAGGTRAPLSSSPLPAAAPAEAAPDEAGRGPRNPYFTSAPFRDRVRIRCEGGTGGRGGTSFIHTPRGKGAPDGASGGAGGSVTVRASAAVESLEFPRFHFRGGRGGRGGARRMGGRKGTDEVVLVPVGTVVREILATDPETRDRETSDVADLVRDGQEVMVAAGGQGGRGNRAYRSSAFRKPEFSAEGEPGEASDLELELKLIADAGLVGFPNAGKSSLLRALSRARPKVAAYPFTTLRPTVGVVELDDPRSDPITVADIPGLVEGAHLNVGLGHQFLRHVERTRALVFVLDAAATEGRDPAADYLNLRRELGMYSRALMRRPSVVFANKADADPAVCRETAEIVRGVAPEGTPVLVGSALTGEGVRELVSACEALLRAELEGDDR